MADSAKRTLDDFWVPWVDITPDEIEEFRRTLDTAPGEAAMQIFLEENPRFLCQHLPAARGYWVIPTKRLGSEHVTDFLLGEDTPHQRTWHAVELERPQALIFTKRGDPAGALTLQCARSMTGATGCHETATTRRAPRSYPVLVLVISTPSARAW